MALRKERNEVRRNYIAFYTTDGMKNWIDDRKGYEKQSSFIHRKLEQLRKQETED